MAKGIALHLIVIAGLFLMPGGCPPPANTVNLAVSTTGQGSVGLSPDGGKYDPDTAVTLTATASTGWTFDHWEGALTGSTNPATVTMDAAKQVTAVFVLIGNNSGNCTEWDQTDITSNTTIPAGCWLINDDITVHNNATLTLVPGTTLQFAAGKWLHVATDGALNAVGTAGNPIVLTGQTKNPGFWIGVRLEDSNSANNVLQYVTIEYGGYSYGGTANLRVDGTSQLSISHCTLSDGSGYGFQFFGSASIAFDANIVIRNHTGAGEVDPWLAGALTATSTYTPNTSDILTVDEGTIDVPETWSSLGLTYMLTGDLTVNKQLTLSPGVQVAFAADSYMHVTNTGALTAIGTAVNPIVLTGQTKNPGSWIGVQLDNSNSANNVLQYVTIEYGGHSYGGTANLHLSGTSKVSVSNCYLTNSSGYGFQFFDTATITFDTNTVRGNHTGAGEVDPWLVGALTATSTYTPNTSDILTVDEGSLGVAETWSSLGLTYMVTGDLTVDNHLTLSPGVQVAFAADSYMHVTNTGALTAIGTSGNHIVLTGQTKNAGSWIGVQLDNSNSANNILQYVTIEYGGHSYGGTANLLLDGISQASLTNCIMQYSTGWGIWRGNQSTLTETGTTYTNNTLGTRYNQP